MTTTIDVAALTPVRRRELAALLAEFERRRRQRLLDTMFPASGPLRRELYPKQLAFFRLGAQYRERVFLAGNRVGKTVAAGTEWAYHLTGRYPNWWQGWRFDHPVKLLASGDTHETTRDILQQKMLGTDDRDRTEAIGTGLIPGDAILQVVPRTHIKGAVEKVLVKHASGGTSELWLRSYVQGREIFQGFELDGFWPDEECPEDVYNEGQVRLMTTHGISTLTFTPLNGLTPLLMHLLEGADVTTGADTELPQAGRAIVMCGWDDVPHLSEAIKAEMLAKLPEYQRAARSKGIPSMGSGAVFTVAEEEIKCAPFVLPDIWPRIVGIDFGIDHPSAGVWLAWDRDKDVIYVYDAYRVRGETPTQIVPRLHRRGKWVPVAWPPDGLQRSKGDGIQLAEQYRGQGAAMLHEYAQLPETGDEAGRKVSRTSVEAGVMEMLQRMQDGRFKVFSNLDDWFGEYRLYHRKDGVIVGLQDDLMDATRYGVVMRRYAKVPPDPQKAMLSPRRDYDWRAG